MGPGPKAGNDTIVSVSVAPVVDPLQWGPARRPGMTRWWKTGEPSFLTFNGARPEGRE